MLDFPKSTLVHKRMPKEAFYKHLALTSSLKEKFVSDVGRIFVENSFTKENLRFSADSDIKEILLLAVFLKKQAFDAKIIEAIARQNPHKLVFLLCFGEQRQLAVYQGKLYRTPWAEEKDLTLNIKGFTINEVWETFVERIALYEERAAAAGSLNIEERLALQEKIVRLEKQIQKTEAAAWKETQPKKRFALYQKVQKYKQEMEKLQNGGLHAVSVSDCKTHNT